MLQRALALAFVTTLGGCALLTHPIEKPTAQVRGVSVTAVSFNGIDGEIALDIQNPNAFGVPLAEVDWQLSIGGQPSVSGRIDLAETIPARGTAPVRAVLHVSPMDAIQTAEAYASGSRDYTLAARLTFTTKLGEVGVDVQSTGDLGG
jgi:hypothetical protein